MVGPRHHARCPAPTVDTGTLHWHARRWQHCSHPRVRAVVVALGLVTMVVVQALVAVVVPLPPTSPQAMVLVPWLLVWALALRVVVPTAVARVWCLTAAQAHHGTRTEGWTKMEALCPLWRHLQVRGATMGCVVCEHVCMW